MKNVYLIGMMGSGKTSSGHALAKLIGISFVDLDDQIEASSGHSINDIFKTQGESYFRNLESKLLTQVSRSQGQVVATGGGIVLNPANSERMKSTGLVIYLKTSLDVLWDRVREKKNRPLLATSDPRKSLADLFHVRAPLYEQSTDKVFLTDRKTPQAVAREIYETCFGKK